MTYFCLTESQKSLLLNCSSKSSFKKLASPPVYPATSCRANTHLNKIFVKLDKKEEPSCFKRLMDKMYLLVEKQHKNTTPDLLELMLLATNPKISYQFIIAVSKLNVELC